MAVTVSALMAGLQIIKYATAQMERFERGEMTAEELQAAWVRMGISLEEANRLWEDAAT